MERNDYMSIADFAAITRTTRDTLLYYDKIGLLKPSVRGENKYRYYSSTQMLAVNLIRTCQSLGLSLSDVKNFAEHRTPELMEELMEKQIKLIDKKISEWVNARKLLYLIKKTIQSVENVDVDEMTIKFLPAEAIVLGGLNDYSHGKDGYDALLEFYLSCKEQYPDLDLNYPAWGMFSAERINNRDWIFPDRYYFYCPEGHDKKNAALYAIGYMRGGYGQGGELYERMLDYIDSSGFEICGPTFEEYPLNELSVSDENAYLMRLLITVREKSGNKFK